jgi:glutamate carboxypeptidase
MGGSVAGEVRGRLEPRAQEMADLLAELVGIESGSDDPVGLAEMADRLEALFGDFGTLTRHPLGPDGAPHLDLEVAGADAGAPSAVVLGHYDTVWSRGTLSRMPLRIADGILTGPGSFDMKSGLVLLYHALCELRALERMPARPLRILLTCDEEVSSRTSRALITTVATGAAVAYVLESPLPGGALKTARKGISTYRLTIEGRAAHAGIEPDKGASAIVELAHQVRAIHDLNDRERGTTVNVGVVRGGTRPNVVAAHAEAEIDVRVATAAEASRVDQAITELTPVGKGTTVAVRIDASRPPMESTTASRRLFAQARAIAAGMGITDLREGSTGGASDANLVAAMGVPTLDGLGPEGGGAHADHEHVVIETMPRRAALIAGLLAEV